MGCSRLENRLKTNIAQKYNNFHHNVPNNSYLFLFFRAMNTVVNNVAIEEPMEEEWTYDPNEPRYCICNQVSYGDMVACDNQDVSFNSSSNSLHSFGYCIQTNVFYLLQCPYEWFHYPCVGITAPPKGKWYCPQCQTNMRRNRAHRKN